MTDFQLLLIILTIKGLTIPLIPLNLVAFKVLFERKIIGWIQERPGPNRVGPWGILQGFVDAVKLMFKEDLMPRGAHPFLFALAPCLTLVVAFMTIAVVPFGPDVEIMGQTVSMAMSDTDYALIFFFAIGSLSVYGIVLAGWSSNNKWSLMGGLRSSAQMVSYEITLALSVVGVLLLTGTFDLNRIVSDYQAGGFWNWIVWQQPLACILFFISGVAETNRLPFDLPEGESELTGGFHTEYSTMKFAMFFMSEYVHMFTMSAIFVTLFMGGYHGPIPIPLPEIAAAPWLMPTLVGFFWIMAKIFVMIFIFIWMRGTLPRLRYDQLMKLGWMIMFPLALLNVFVTALVITLAPPDSPLVQKALLFVIGLGIILVTDYMVTDYRRRSLRVI